MTDIPQRVLDYLSSSKTVTLATASPDAVPHASTFMYVNDGLSLYIWARGGSATARHVRRNPHVSFAIDEYVEDWNKAKGIQGNGECEPVSAGDEMGQVIGLFAEKFPSPSSGASTANISFFKIKPTKLQFIDNTGTNFNVANAEFGPEFNREEVLFSD